MVTKQDVFRLLEEFGVRHDDKITVHSSLRAVGKIEGGADGLLDALCEYLYDGLLLIPTHTWENIDVTLQYDVRETVPCIGALPRIAAFRKDAVRSLHPTHSVAAFGKNAAEYVRGEEKCATPTPPDCCLSRLYDENGKIILIGVGHESNTFLHAVDERLSIPNRINPKPLLLTIKDYEGRIVQSPPFHAFYTEGVPLGCSEYYGNYEKPLAYTGAVMESTLGNATVLCCDARKTLETIKKLWDRAEYDLCAQEKETPETYYK